MFKKFLSKFTSTTENHQKPNFEPPSKEDCLKLIKADALEWNKLKQENTEWMPDLDEVNFENANLYDVDLKNCSLKRADLSQIINLQEKSLGGSNLDGAKLPPNFKFGGLDTVKELSMGSSTIFIMIMILCFYCWLTICSTNDLYLLKNSGNSILPIINVPLDIIGFYISAPLLLLAFYVYFQLNLKKLWHEFSELPVYFPDGKSIDQKSYSWLINDLVINYMRLLRNENNVFLSLQNKMVIFLVWGLVPITILAIWGKYLITHDLVLTSFHSILLSFCIMLGVIFFNNARQTLRIYPKQSKNLCTKKCIVGFALFVPFLIFIAFINSSTNLYRDKYGTEFYFGYHYKFDNGTEIAKRPEKWTEIEQKINLLERAPAGSRYDPRADKALDDILEPIKSVDLANKNLVGIAVSNSFLVNSDLSNSNLNDSSLPGGYFQRANLENARFENANLWGANFKNAYLAGANLRKSVLREANLENTELSAADLRGADLTQADLQNANLYGTDLTDAYLSGADLRDANFSGANLQKTDLSGAIIENTIFFGTDLRNNDLSSVEGLTYSQINSAIIDEKTKLPDSLSRYKDQLIQSSKIFLNEPK